MNGPDMGVSLPRSREANSRSNGRPRTLPRPASAILQHVPRESRRR
jgi:hypothetical protein